MKQYPARKPIQKDDDATKWRVYAAALSAFKGFSIGKPEYLEDDDGDFSWNIFVNSGSDLRSENSLQFIAVLDREGHLGSGVCFLFVG